MSTHKIVFNEIERKVENLTYCRLLLNDTNNIKIQTNEHASEIES